jgi:hypothetical protein
MLRLPSYKFYTNTSRYDYEFESQGAKGIIKKIARFDIIERNFFNFGFGDLDVKTGNISDNIISNNGDRDIVLATVAKIIYDFVNHFPEATILIKGTDASRTRLYQQGISRYWDEIGILFEIQGNRERKWELFESGKNYDAFSGRLKGRI